MAENLLCYGDSANFLRDKDLFPDESVRLICVAAPLGFDFRAGCAMMLGKT